MVIVEQPDVLSPSTRRIIRIHAKKLIRRRAFSGAEQEDIEQELSLHVLQGMASFDAAKANRDTFISRVVAHRAANLLRDRLRQLRNRFAQISLEDLSEEELAREDESHEQLAADIATVQATLPPQLREMCELLKREGPSDVARRLGVPRSTLDQLIREVREYFAEAGLRDYL